VLRAEVVHAAREEMVETLADVVFRRTDLGTAGHPGDDALRECAALAAEELGWDDGRAARELADVRSAFPTAPAAATAA
jgi:glycerol-3-phosphate dehydrogenase